MPYKLLITIRSEVPERYREMVAPYEGIRGIKCTIHYSVKNIGNEKFPGGKVVKLQYESPIGMHSLTSTALAHPEEIKELKKGERVSKVDSFMPINDGLYIIHLKIVANDDQKIEFYQSESGSPLPREEWIKPLYIIRRENLHLFSLMTEISKQLAKR